MPAISQFGSRYRGAGTTRQFAPMALHERAQSTVVASFANLSGQSYVAIPFQRATARAGWNTSGREVTGYHGVSKHEHGLALVGPSHCDTALPLPLGTVLVAVAETLVERCIAPFRSTCQKASSQLLGVLLPASPSTRGELPVVAGCAHPKVASRALQREGVLASGTVWRHQ